MATVENNRHASAPAAEWRCPTCARAQSQTYCPSCGERRPRAHDLTLHSLLEQSVESLMHVDGRVFRTFRDLLLRPGQLTASYLQGQRRPYIAPVPLFLIANLLFFAVGTLTGIKIFSTPLHSHLHQQFYSALAQTLVSKRIDALHTTLESFTPMFDHAIALHVKSLIILLMPPVAIAALLLFWRRRLPIGAHVIFALHYCAYLMIGTCCLLPLAWANAIGVPPEIIDRGSGLLQLTLSGVYFFVASGRVYGSRGVMRVVAVVCLLVATFVAWFGYRFTLFIITLYTT